jgi:Carboxypeptidase regulatory-like domain/TonB-dependent Receptor Plug Domain
VKTKRALIIAVFLWALPVFAQSTTGELRLTVTDPAGLGVKGTVELVSQGNGYSQTFTTDDQGKLGFKRLPYGIYRVQIAAKGFAEVSEPVEIRSALPVNRTIKLRVASVSESVKVTDTNTLIDPYRAGSVNEIGADQIQDRLTAIPGRSMQDLVNSQPGWLYEGNAVLHPRGSEYQTQFVVDGIPLTDNRSPSFGPEAAEADDVQSLKIYTAGIPAEYGRKMGGVVEINTLRNSDPGLHGTLTLFGGSYSTASAGTQDQYTWGKNTIGVSASGNMTSHYLNPVVPENYTNTGTTGNFSGSYERDLTEKDRLTLIVRHELARYQIPNELVQQNGAYLPNSDNDTGCPPVPPDQEPADCVFIPGGQLQTGGNFETMGSASYQHVFSADAIGWLRFMARDNNTNFNSNPASWPLNATQRNDFREVYFNASGSLHHGRHEFKAGVESDNIFLHENTSYVMPYCDDPTNPQCPIALGIFDTGATSFAFTGQRPDLEQALYVQDLIRLGNWTINAGLRWDHYQLLVNQNAVEPRIAASRYFPTLGLNLHGSFDRIFQTPSFENILLGSSPQAESIDTSAPAVLLPVQPSHGDYYELGATQALFGRVRVDANMFRRDVNNYADDSQLLSTGISFPVAFRTAILYGAEGKIEVPHWGPFSGFVSYSYIVGNAFNPVTGGLFLGDDAAAAVTQLTGHSPDSQDQRHTLRSRARYQIAPRLWMAVGANYNTGLPFQADLTPQQYATEYGQTVIDHLNFNRGRISPYFTQNLSVGADLLKREKRTLRFQGDIANVSNTLELIDFGGLFSGNAIGPGRQYTFRMVATF